MPTRTWPDGSTFQACAQNPSVHFLDPELAAATFESDRKHGGAQAWSGGRATVIRANRPTGGSVAVRFSKQEDQEASVRYHELSRHLSSNPVSTMVSTSWTNNGLRISGQHYPLLKMDWVSGKSLDNYVSKRIGAPGATGDFVALAQAWRESCLSLTAARISHGDIHAGNTLVCENGGRPVELRLVDYDNVWLPGLHTPLKESGHPAFQHPRRSELPAGPDLDALPNTLTYLSLTALAADPALWQFHNSDDRLLFEKSDLSDPSKDVWTALLQSPDAAVASLARVTVAWLRGSPGRFESLEHALTAAGQHPAPQPHGRVYVWHPQPPAGSGTVPANRAWPPGPTGTTVPPPQQPAGWPPRSAGATAAGPVQGRQTWPGLAQPPTPMPGRHPAPSSLSPPVPPSQQVPEKNNRAALVFTVVILAVIVAVMILSGIAQA